MKARSYIEKTREYLDYLEEHINNVEKAWNVFKEKCGDIELIFKGVDETFLYLQVKNHDVSKFSENEFVQYRRSFYPIIEDEYNHDFSKAWDHHKKENSHHWENWTKRKQSGWRIHCAHMIIDWMAMGYKFGDTAQSYYEKNKDEIKIPDYAMDFVYDIFERIK